MADVRDGPVALPLQGLAMHLVQAGFPLSVRDVEDAWVALRRGHGIGSRDALLRLLTTLWARGDLEAARLEALFRRFPWPTEDELRTLAGGTGGPDPAAQPGGRPDAGGAMPTPRAGEPGAGSVAAGAGPLVEFSAAGGCGPGGLPVLRHARVPLRHWAFEPRPLVGQRAMTVAWRRLRRAQRSGPRTEIDLEATIAARCRDGFVAEPVRVPARRNQSRLVVLVDASASMEPWRRMQPLLAASLAAGQLAQVRLLYFDNDPCTTLAETAGGGAPCAFEDLLRASGGSSAIVVGDAGAARGRLDRERIAGTREFLRRARTAWARIAWLNPMPAARWSGTSAARIAREPLCAMFEWTEDGLARAVDHLRA